MHVLTENQKIILNKQFSVVSKRAVRSLAVMTGSGIDDVRQKFFTANMTSFNASLGSMSPPGEPTTCVRGLTFLENKAFCVAIYCGEPNQVSQYFGKVKSTDSDFRVLATDRLFGYLAHPFIDLLGDLSLKSSQKKSSIFSEDFDPSIVAEYNGGIDSMNIVMLDVPIRSRGILIRLFFVIDDSLLSKMGNRLDESEDEEV